MNFKLMFMTLILVIMTSFLFGASQQAGETLTDSSVGVGKINIDGNLGMNSHDVSAVGKITSATVEINDSDTQIYESESELILKDSVSGAHALSEFLGGGGTSYWEKLGTVIRSNSTEVTYSTDDFVFGSPQLADDGNTDHDSRMFFDKSKAAFRAGSVGSTEWDDSNVGISSIAFGSGCTAKGSGSIAMGNSCYSSANRSIAIGDNSSSQSWGAAAIGYYCTVGSNATAAFAAGYGNTANGFASVALGNSTTASGEDSISLGSAITVSGNNSCGLNLDDTARTLSQANTLAIMGGQVGIGTLTPKANFDLSDGTSVLSIGGFPDGMYLAENAYNDVMFWKHIGTGYAGLSGFSETNGNYIIWNSTASGSAEDSITWNESVTIQPDGKVGIGNSYPNGKLDVAGDIYPSTNNSYYLGKNDDDTPFAWKGVILKDTTNGKYYRIEVISGVVTATDLTD